MLSEIKILDFILVLMVYGGLRAHRNMVREYNAAMINRRLGENSKVYFAEMRYLWERFSSYPILQTQVV